MGAQYPAHIIGRKPSWHHYRHGRRRRRSAYFKYTASSGSEEEKEDPVLEAFINFISKHSVSTLGALKV